MSIKFKYTADDVKRKYACSSGSMGECAKALQKEELLELVKDARANHCPGTLADVVEFLVTQLDPQL